MIVLITGATSGFGRACAKLFSKKGYKTILIGRRKERLLKLAKKLAIDYTNRKMLKLVFEKIVLGKDEFSTKIFAQRKFRENLTEEIAEKSKIPKSHIFIDVSTATSVPTTSTKESFKEITVLLNNTRKKEFEITKATELPLMNAILGYMNIIRIYTTATYKKKLNTTVKGIFEKEVL